MTGSRLHRTARKPATTGEVWTPDMVRALGVATDLRTAASIFGITASSAYNMVSRGAFPVPVIRAGGIYRVPVAAILTALHLDHGDATAASEDDAGPPDSSPARVPAYPPPGGEGGLS
jgi:hypothetical protein